MTRRTGNQDYLDKGWKRETCSRCVNGVVGRYTDGSPDECRHCANGMVWITPKGRIVKWPGGPFA